MADGQRETMRRWRRSRKYYYCKNVKWVRDPLFLIFILRSLFSWINRTHKKVFPISRWTVNLFFMLDARSTKFQLSIDSKVTRKHTQKPGDRLTSQQTNKERLKDFAAFFSAVLSEFIQPCPCKSKLNLNRSEKKNGKMNVVWD